MRLRMKRTVLILLGYMPCALFVSYLCGDTGFSIIPSRNANTSKSNSALSAKRRLISRGYEASLYISNFTRKSQSIATVRPKRCQGCFKTTFPILTDQPDVCKSYGNQTIELVFLIISEPRLYARREAIRETWASVTRNNTSDFRHVFIFGTTSNYRQQQDLRRESAQFRDVVVSGFHESYNNLTLKTMMGLRWAVTRCRHARFFMKVDDDVWISPDSLKDVLRKNGAILEHRLGGHCHNYTEVLRSRTNKWSVSYEDYPYSHYPAYCGGPAYLGGMDVAEGVVAVSKDVPYFRLEDVYMGMCLQAAGIRTFNLGRITVNSFNASKICYNKMVLAAIHRVRPSLLRALWSARCDDQLHLLGVRGNGSNLH